MALYINELLPNPIGKDKDGEFVELWNSGTEVINLSGYVLTDKSGKKFKLQGQIKPDDFLVLPASLTKITLNNSNEAVMLYNTDGRLIQKAEFLGEAKEGASYARVGDKFIFTNYPTPGAANKLENLFTVDPTMQIKNTGAIIYNQISFLELGFIILAVAATFGFGVIYLIKTGFVK